MNKSYKVFFTAISLSLILVIGSVGLINANEAPEEKIEQYKNLLRGIDGAIRNSRFDENPQNSLEESEKLYTDLIEGIELDQDLEREHEYILDKFNDLINRGENAESDDIRELRGNIMDIADSLNINLPFHFRYSILIIAGLSILLSFGVSILNRVTVDWKKVNASKARMKEWQNKLRKAQNEGKDKEIRKLKRQQSQLMSEQKTVMFSVLKPMLLYMIPFILFWWIMDGIFGGWVVAWVPFNLPWPNLGIALFSGTVASMGFVGWYLLSYFGFSQIWRRFLIPER